MSNLPPGTWEGDPRAPWNQDPERCPSCKDDMEWDDENEVWRCTDSSCPRFDEDHEEMTAEDIAYLKAEQSEEWERRGGGGL